MPNLPDVSNWDEIADQSLNDFRDLLRFNTTNPPGNEVAAAKFVAKRLSDVGIRSIDRSSGDRPNVIARLRGDGTGGGPLLITGHLDVVPVEREHWSHDPFGAEIHDGYLYGRGAIDMKNMVTMCLTVMQLLKLSGAHLTRDVIFAAVSDEEEGCHHGSRFLVENHPDDVRAEFMLGEIGGFPLDVNGVRYYPVQIAEKGVCQFRLRARGTPGHGSMPHEDNAVVKLSEALVKLGRVRLPQHHTAAVARNIKTLAATQPAPARYVLPLLLNPRTAGFVLDRVIPKPELRRTLAASLSNTVSPTILRAGVKTNVIPGVAEAVLDGRTLPNQTSADLFREIRALIGEGFEFEIIHEATGREERADDALYAMIKENIVRHDPTGIPLPAMIPGFTDAQQFGRLGAKCYGYSPVHFPVEDNVVFTELFHGHNERIHVDGYKWGVRCLWDLVRRFVTA